MQQKLSITMFSSTDLPNQELIKIDDTSHVQALDLPEIDEATLFIKEASEKTPTQAKWLEDLVPSDLFGRSISPGAVLILRTKNAVFAISFGQGRHLISKEHLTLDFGLKVVLNSVDSTEIRSVDKASNGKKPLNSRNQGIDTSNIIELLFDPEEDIATSITGRSKKSLFNGSIISGRDAFSIQTDISPTNIHTLLEEIYKQYNSKAYKAEFSFIDDIKRIRNVDHISRLDTELAFRIDNDLDMENCWLAPPKIIDWESITSFAFTGRPSATAYSTLELSALLEQIRDKNEAITVSNLRSQNILTLDSNFHRIHSWKAYECLYAEIKLESDHYLLRNGSWFQIDNNFVERVNHSIAKIPRYEVDLPDYNHADENDYNESTAKILDNSFSMDAKNIMHGGGHSKIEFCDVVIHETDLMHMKRGTNSSSLSHLFSQGVVSAESFRADQSFRHKLLMRLPEAASQSLYANRPEDGQFRVVYAIVSGKNGELQLPFFSRVTLKNAAKKLESMGFRLAISKIGIDEAFKAKQKPRSKSNRKAA